MKQLINDIRNNSSATLMMIRVELKRSVATTRLGWLYWIIDPIVMMTIYYFMVKIVFNRGGENYHLFALCGIATWQFFTRSVTKSTTAFNSNLALIRQIGIPLSIYVFVPVAVQSFFALISYLIIMFWNYNAIGLQTFALLPLMILIYLITFGIGLFLSVVEVYFKDTNNLITYILRAGFFLTPILYSAERVYSSPNVPEFAKVIYGLNPMAWAVPAIRCILLDGVLFNTQQFLLIFVISLLFVQLGLLFLRSNVARILKSL